MRVAMIGVDYNKANLNTRENFAFTKEEIKKALKNIVNEKDITGAVLLSTCNRTELWVSCESEDIDLKTILLKAKKISFSEAEKYIDLDIFSIREGVEAIEHLMITACGINSKVFGEDQILTQIREALDISRENLTSSTTLEKVFQNAIAAGKKVKDSVRLTRSNPSVATSGIKELKAIYGSLEGKVCLLIGNGNMASLIAQHLVDSRARVFMTRRKKYHKGDSQQTNAVKGCDMIAYEDRFKYIPMADIVISATLSPHHTIKLEDLDGLNLKEPSVWLDLAVPRDIDYRIGEKYHITIWDIDNMQEDVSQDMEDELRYAKEIIGAYRDEIVQWLSFRKCIPHINTLMKEFRKDVYERGEKSFKSIVKDEVKEQELNVIVNEITTKALGKVLFGLKDTLEEEQWETVFKAMVESAKKDTLKS